MRDLFEMSAERPEKPVEAFSDLDATTEAENAENGSTGLMGPFSRFSGLLTHPRLGCLIDAELHRAGGLRAGYFRGLAMPERDALLTLAQELNNDD